MYSKLLVPIDGSDNSFRALDNAIFLSKEIRARITALHVRENLPFVYVQSEKALNKLISKYENKSKRILDKVKKRGNKNEVNVEFVLMKGDAASGIIDFSKKGNYDTIIMGRRGMGRLSQLLLGSTSNKVLNHSECTIVIVNRTRRIEVENKFCKNSAC
jgi:nucleotide-binding universal stress UspA family protein